MRLFIAAELPLNLREALAETQAVLRARIRGRYVPFDSFHATLAFLGEVPGSQVEAVAGAMERACAGVAPISVRLGQLGSFGRRQGSVLWQGIESGELGELAGAVRSELAASGFSYDEVPFLAHVTLMRGADVREGSAGMPVIAAGTISSVALLSSELGEGPAHYTVLHRVDLGEEES